MSRGLLFWILMLFCVIFWPPWPWWPVGWPAWPGHIVLIVLFALLGWQVFGPPLHG